MSDVRVRLAPQGLGRLYARQQLCALALVERQRLDGRHDLADAYRIAFVKLDAGEPATDGRGDDEMIVRPRLAFFVNGDAQRAALDVSDLDLGGRRLQGDDQQRGDREREDNED